MEILKRLSVFRYNHHFALLSAIIVSISTLFLIGVRPNIEIQAYMKALILFFFYIFAFSKQKIETEETKQVEYKSSFYTLNILLTAILAFLMANAINGVAYKASELFYILLCLALVVKIVSKNILYLADSSLQADKKLTLVNILFALAVFIFFISY